MGMRQLLLFPLADRSRKTERSPWDGVRAAMLQRVEAVREAIRWVEIEDLPPAALEQLRFLSEDLARKAARRMESSTTGGDRR